MDEKVVLVGNEEELEGLTLSEKLKKMERVASKRPDVLDGKTYQRIAEGRKWYITINKDEHGMPCEVFTHTNARESSVVILDAIEKITKLAKHHDVNEVFLKEQLLKSKYQSNSSRLCRLISLCLRHGVPLLDIVDTLDLLEHTMGNLTWHIYKILAMCLDDLPKKSSKFKPALNVCPQCKQDTLVYETGCKKCLECGFFHCG